ncbi:MAG: flagellar export chaperone FliS [Planctomycetota bacterium]
MTMPSNQANAYLRTQVMTANPAELRLMLFDGALKFGEQAKVALQESDFEALYDATIKCQNIVMELINGLRPEVSPELCEKLSGLYTFIYGRLVRASTERDVTLLDEALELLRYERETWVLLMDKSTTTSDAEPLASLNVSG